MFPSQQVSDPSFRGCNVIIILLREEDHGHYLVYMYINTNVSVSSGRDMKLGHFDLLMSRRELPWTVMDVLTTNCCCSGSDGGASCLFGCGCDPTDPLETV